MARQRDFQLYVGDFETTVFSGQEYTEVWASAVVKFYEDDVIILHSIDETFDFLTQKDEDIIIYYHNLKFDGEFWLSYLLRNNFETALTADKRWLKDSEMKNNQFKYMISDMGQFYSITIKYNRRIINIRDSLKLLPFSVRKIGESFGTKHKKLDMEYEGFRYAGCTITAKEQEYIKNDVLVIKEALEICHRKGHDKLTIGSCCLSEYKSILGYTMVQDFFPDLTQYTLDEKIYGTTNADKYIRKSYKGGWCYLVKGKENKIFKNGITLDVNSLYPSMMSSESGNYYPVGEPHFWKGNEIPLRARMGYYFVRIKTRFELKKGFLPCIQIKNNASFIGTDYLTTSDIWDVKNKRYIREYYDPDGNYHDGRQILTLTCTDYDLIRQHYNLIDCEILDGVYFSSRKGIFDKYIETYKEQKLNNTGALRELAKLFLNNLYGKLASSDDSSFKVAKLVDGVVKYDLEFAHDKSTFYIACGSAITSYARNFTIRAAQANYHGTNKPGFIYADTDSLHMDISPEAIQNIRLHDKNFCCWKMENQWDEGFFARQKTYIEIGKQTVVKCAGMPEMGKKMFMHSIDGTLPDKDKIKNYNEKQIKWMKVRRTIKDFTVGLTIPDAKLLPKRIQGGVVLVPTTYEMRA